jgi:hypothetical protein
LIERAPVEPAGTAMIERSDSGTFRIPLFTVSSEVGISDFVDGEIKAAAISNNTPAPAMAMVRNSQVDPERRNRNLQWLRLHFRALGDVGRLPFNNADLWQLHQYYFSPPMEVANEIEQFSTGFQSENVQRNIDIEYTRSALSQGTMYARNSFGADSMQGKTHSHKRRPDNVPSDVSTHVAKRPKNLQPRIAYYPRVMVSFFQRFIVGISILLIDSFSSYSQKFNLLEPGQRKKRFPCCVNLSTRKVIFANRNPYSVENSTQANLLDHDDIDMILLDLL